MKQRSKKEELLDRKIENLLETYKRQDEELLRKAQEKDYNSRLNKRVMKDKFGFLDDDEDEEEDYGTAQNSKHVDSGSDLKIQVKNKKKSVKVA